MGNANSGRRPKPVALRIYEGTNKRPLPKELPTRELDPEPPVMPKRAQQFWDWLVSVMAPMGILTESDRAIMTEASWHYQLAEESRQEVSASGMFYEAIVTLDREGNVVEPDSPKARKAIFSRKENPALRTAARESQALERCLSKMGLSPVDRARLAQPQARKRESLLTG